MTAGTFRSTEGKSHVGATAGFGLWLSRMVPSGPDRFYGIIMGIAVIVIVVVLAVALLGLLLAVRVVKQYEDGVLFRFGRVIGERQPGLRFIVPLVDVMHRVSLRIVTMPIQSQGIITRDNVSVDVSAVAYFKVVDAVKSVVAIENVYSAIDQIAQTTLRKVVGQHTLDQTLSETDKINLDIRAILDVTTVDWGVEVTLVELKDIQLPDSMKRAMARQAEAEREKRAKIINAEGESLAAAALGDASDTMMAHPLALQLRNLQSLVEIGVDKNTTVVFPAPLMTTIAELGSFLAREAAAATSQPSSPSNAPTPSLAKPLTPVAANGQAVSSTA
jgi:regulator of protease activity HflC (stomatin/prohibitin superfamily)